MWTGTWYPVDQCLMKTRQAEPSREGMFCFGAPLSFKPDLLGSSSGQHEHGHRCTPVWGPSAALLEVGASRIPPNHLSWGWAALAVPWL